MDAPPSPNDADRNRTFHIGIGIILTVGLLGLILLGVQERERQSRLALAPQSTPTPFDPWVVSMEHFLREAWWVWEDAQALKACWPLITGVDPTCIELYDRVTNRASDLYFELEHHAWPLHSCGNWEAGSVVEAARDQLAYALDDLRNRPADLQAAELHLRLAEASLFCP